MIFVDTWAWLALAYARDPYHASAAREHAALQKAKQRYVTSDYVLSEFLSALFGVLPFVKARAFADDLLQACRSGRYRLVFISESQFDEAWQLRQRYHDKPDISFVDLTSMVVMRDLGVNEIFTGDDHFRQVGLGFQVRP